MRQKVTIQQELPTEKAKEIVKLLKESKIKVQGAIREGEVRVTGKNRDDLQAAIALIKGEDFELDLQYTNFREARRAAAPAQAGPGWCGRQPRSRASSRIAMVQQGAERGERHVLLGVPFVALRAEVGLAEVAAENLRRPPTRWSRRSPSAR